MRLPTLAASCAAVARAAAASTRAYLACLTRLCGQEVAQREQTQAARRIAPAPFPWPKTLDAFDVSAAPTVQQAAVVQLVSGACVRAHEHWLGLGGPGVGKTHFRCGVGRARCPRGFRVRFRTAVTLVNELLLADQAHCLPRLLKHGRSSDLVIVDEVGSIPVSTVGAQRLFQFVADRQAGARVAISSHVEFARCTEVFHAERMTAARLDRRTFKRTVMVIEGESYRLQASRRRQAAG